MTLNPNQIISENCQNRHNYIGKVSSIIVEQNYRLYILSLIAYLVYKMIPNLRMAIRSHTYHDACKWVDIAII